MFGCLNQGMLVISNPDNACSDVSKPPSSANDTNFFLLVKRYGCTFQEKVCTDKCDLPIEQLIVEQFRPTDSYFVCVISGHEGR